MNQIDVLLNSLQDPGDRTAWLALADALEEVGQPERGELMRLTCRLRAFSPGTPGTSEQQRVQELLQSGVLPCVPELVNSIGMRFALIPAGTFLMGSPDVEEGRSEADGPVHEVEITKPFYLGVHPVTQEQYEKVMGSNPSFFSSTGDGNDMVIGLNTRAFPVEQVSWRDAQTFVKKLSARPEEKKVGRRYRLPTEAEWEYSCRGGLPSYSIFHFGNSLSSTQANFNGNLPYGGADKGPYLERTCSVGSYPPNPFGLWDMHGNVWEWCQDWYDEEYYAKSPVKDPSGPSRGSSRVFRGGRWLSAAGDCSSSYRDGLEPGECDDGLGFRVLAVSSGKK